METKHNEAVSELSKPNLLTNGLLIVLVTVAVLLPGCSLFKPCSGQPEVIYVDSSKTITTIDTSLGQIRPIVIPGKSISFTLNPALIPLGDTTPRKKKENGITAGFKKDTAGNYTIYCSLDSMILIADSLRALVVKITTNTKEYRTQIKDNKALTTQLKQDRNRLLLYLITTIILLIAVITVIAYSWFNGAPVKTILTKIPGSIKKLLKL